MYKNIIVSTSWYTCTETLCTIKYSASGLDTFSQVTLYSVSTQVLYQQLVQYY